MTPRPDRNFWISLLSQIVSYCIILGSPTLYLLFIFGISTDTVLYFFADNLLLLTIPPGLALVALRDMTDQHHDPHFARRSQWGVLMLGGVFGLVMVWQVNQSLSIRTWGYGIALALQLTFLYRVIMNVPAEASGTTITIRDRYLYALLIVILGTTYALTRWLPDATILARYGLVPVVIFLLPGMALSPVILSEHAPALQRVIYSVPLSLGWYAVLSAWAFQLGLPVNGGSFYLFALLALSIGAGIRIYQTR
ncbi:MAG: hypothetical protein ACFE0Q_19325 [Anaerolineae bacterium]